MTFENYIVITIGLITLVCGPLLVRHRAKVFRIIAGTNRALGGAAGREVAKRSSPWWIGFERRLPKTTAVVVVGSGFALVGTALIQIGGVSTR